MPIGDTQGFAHFDIALFCQDQGPLERCTAHQNEGFLNSMINRITPRTSHGSHPLLLSLYLPSLLSIDPGFRKQWTMLRATSAVFGCRHRPRVSSAENGLKTKYFRGEKATLR